MTTNHDLVGHFPGKPPSAIDKIKHLRGAPTSAIKKPPKAPTLPGLHGSIPGCIKVDVKKPFLLKKTSWRALTISPAKAGLACLLQDTYHIII